MFTQQQIEEITEEDVRQMVMGDIFEEELYYGYIEEFTIQDFEDEEYVEVISENTDTMTTFDVNENGQPISDDSETEYEDESEYEDNIMTYLTKHQYNHRTIVVVVNDEETLTYDENEIKQIDMPIFVDNDFPSDNQINYFSDTFIDTMCYYDALSYHMTDKILIKEGYMSASMVIVFGIICRNRQIFKELTDFIDNKHKKENFNIIEQELIAKSLHPSRIEKLINKYGFKGMEQSVF